MDTYGFLDSGTLIQVGTILKMDDQIREVVAFRRRKTIYKYGRDIHNFIVETKFINGECGEEGVEFDKQDLEDMRNEKTLKVYNEG